MDDSGPLRLFGGTTSLRGENTRETKLCRGREKPVASAIVEVEAYEVGRYRRLVAGRRAVQLRETERDGYGRHTSRAVDSMRTASAGGVAGVARGRLHVEAFLERLPGFCNFAR